MPNNRKTTLKKIKGREGVHPGSRKANQINRAHLRKAKLKTAARDRKDLSSGKLFRPHFFLNILQSSEPLTLPQLRELITDVFIARNDERIAELTAERRPGRPKQKELVDLEELRRTENAEWETGFEVPDLTDPKATRLMYTWLETGTRLRPAHVDLLPWIRVARDTPDVTVSSRPGRLAGMGLGQVTEAAMAVDGDEDEGEEGEDDGSDGMEA